MTGKGNSGKLRQKLPTSTVSPARIMLCQATQRPIYRTGERVTTSWGWCKVTGRFGQRHQDIMDAFMWNAEGSREVDDGKIELLVDPAKVRMTISDDGYSHGRLKTLINEIMQVTVELKVTNGLWAIGGLLDHVKESPATKPNPLTRGERNLWRVRLGSAFVQLLKNDLPLHYDPRPIARLRYGISQAISRHVLSHSLQPNGGWVLDGLIEAVAGKMSAGDQRNKRRDIRLDVQGLAGMGIVLDGERIYRHLPKACSTGLVRGGNSQKRVAPARQRVAPAQ